MDALLRRPQRTIPALLGMRTERARGRPAGGDQRRSDLHLLAHDRRALPASEISKLQLTIERLEEFGGSPEPPARLHGDLWAGNRMIDGAGRSWLIDPACHGGHREYDLAMMRLFGGFGRECFGGYAAEWPLADGWESRIPLHPAVPTRRPRHQVRWRIRRRCRGALDAVLSN
jgi:aminoglycoside phosphotransferase (APT) family kinase protein